MDAAERARAEVAAVRDDPAARLRLCAITYRGPDGNARRHLPFRRAALSFMRWQLRRGVLATADSPRPGSPWWRAVNERLLLDGREALARSAGEGGAPSRPTIRLWMRFILDPTPETWYRAHNATIVGAYLDHLELARAEQEPERFFMNVVLVRALFAHALVGAPRLALGYLASLARPLGDPRFGMAGGFLLLPRTVPDAYPLAGPVTDYVDAENQLGRLLDYGLISPRLSELYEWSATETREPRLAGLIDAGCPAYAFDVDPRLWHRADSRAVRALRRLVPARRHR